MFSLGKRLRVLLSVGLLFSSCLFLLGRNINAQISTSDLKTSLIQQEKEIEKEIQKAYSQIKGLKQKKITLQGEVSILDNQVKAILLEIKKTRLSIQEIDGRIYRKNLEIEKIQKKIDHYRDNLAYFLRSSYQLNQKSLIEILLGQNNLSGFFENINSIELINQEILNNLGKIKDSKKSLANEKGELISREEELSQVRLLQEIQKRSVVNIRQKKENLLRETGGKEKNFYHLIQKKKNDIESIKRQLFILSGTTSINFGDAFKIAQFVSYKTGIRPAFLLAVLKQESQLGKFVGTGSWKVDMAPSQRSTFLKICQELNLDPNKMPVSKRWRPGWGGAMGPAQFLPKTWLGYRERVSKITSHSLPNPWNMEDAFAAAALKLSQAGANQKTYTAERKAALMYFAGSHWNNPRFAFYGRKVMQKAEEMENDIETIMGKASSN
ncbi:MAG TPA: hypothetical protein ENL06_02700 [Candidatus Portnoybacteria bacterium]|nr:hypothetical protein [Candidatus Portnoybacteria bacterium]